MANKSTAVVPDLPAIDELEVVSDSALPPGGPRAKQGIGTASVPFAPLSRKTSLWRQWGPTLIILPILAAGIVGAVLGARSLRQSKGRGGGGVGHPYVPTAPVDPSLGATPPKPVDPALLALCSKGPYSVPSVNSMTLEEKLGQMSLIADYALGNNSWDVASFWIGGVLTGTALTANYTRQSPDWLRNQAISIQAKALTSRLRIPLIYGIDGVHGHSAAYGATVFPHNIGLGATRDPALVAEISAITASELKGSAYNWDFAPCVAVCRDPRWGRCYESFGEVPEIVSALSGAVVEGLQGVQHAGHSGNGSVDVAASLKHFLADGGTNDGMNAGEATLSDVELRRIHLPPYGEGIKHGVQTIMLSYSSILGVKMSLNTRLVTGWLKEELGFQGIVFSDWKAVTYAGIDPAENIRNALNAGMDMVMVPEDYLQFIYVAKAEVKSGRVNISRIDDAVTRILQVKQRMGLFQKPCSTASLSPNTTAQLRSPHSLEVARRAVRQSLVLLKNQRRKDGLPMWPLAVEGDKILVAGQAANDVGRQSGGWTLTWQGGLGPTVPGTTIVDGLHNLSISRNLTVYYSRDAAAARSVDGGKFRVGVVVVGEQPYAETNGDSTDLALPVADLELVKAVCSQMPCVVILLSGRAVDIAALLPQVDALVAAWLPGPEAGWGVADMLLDSTYDFTGRTPVTWFKTISQLPMPFNAPNGSKPYDPLFALGFGLKKAGTRL